MAYRANVSDKQQGDIESALNDSAIRISWFDGKAEQTGEAKFVRAYDLSGQGNVGAGVTSAVRQFSGSGLSIGCHNDKPARFETPGKA
jgi:hypothetical protein